MKDTAEMIIKEGIEGARKILFPRQQQKQKIMIKVSVNNQKSITKALEIVTSISGAQSASIKGQDLDQIEVIGDAVDAVPLTTLLRKKLGYAELISMSPLEDPYHCSMSSESLADTVETTLELDRATEANGESSFTCETTGWTLLMTSLLLEGMSAIFDQLNYALIGMVMAFAALLLSTFEFIAKARKARVGLDGTSLLPCFYRGSAPNAPSGKPFCTIVEYFGLVGGVWQCFYSGMQYQYSRRNENNPIQMCLLPFIFILGVVISKLIRRESQERLTEPLREDSSSSLKMQKQMQMPLAADEKAVDIGEEVTFEDELEVDTKFDDLDQRLRERLIPRLRQQGTEKSRTLSI